MTIPPFCGSIWASAPARSRAHAFLHPLLSTPLRWLGLAAPEVAWFSWMQLTLLWLACMVSVKALMQCFAKRGFSMALGAAAGAVYLTLFAMTYACHVTFTVTAAVLGAAAVLQLCSIDGERYTDGQVFRALMLALALTALCGGLRLICMCCRWPCTAVRRWFRWRPGISALAGEKSARGSRCSAACA
ncbi:MAG: hypothetical protein ACLUE8_16775 [Lachnospiraceae bacterium]